MVNLFLLKQNDNLLFITNPQRILLDMRLFSLNIYGGRVHDPLFAAIRAHAPFTDVFCFQEVSNGLFSALEGTPPYPTLFEELRHALPDFQPLFTHNEVLTEDQLSQPSSEGLALFIRKGIEIFSVEPFSLFREDKGINSRERGFYERFGQHARLQIGDSRLSVINVHGAAFPGDKLDTPERLAQTDAVLEAMKRFPEPCVVMGDFNLLPEAESVRRFSKAGFVDLVKEYSIPTTRGSLCKQLHPEFSRPPYTVQEYADYTFISPGLVVESFGVPDLPISDHLPMILTFSISKKQDPGT